MEGGHQGNAVVVVEAAAQLGDRLLAAEQGAGPRRSQGHDHLGLDGLYLAQHEGAAAVDLVHVGVAVARRAALEDVADVDRLPGEPHAADDPGEDLPGLADEGLPLQVLVAARRLADKDYPGLGGADAEDQVGPAVPQDTTVAVPQVGPDLVEGLSTPPLHGDRGRGWSLRRRSTGRRRRDHCRFDLTAPRGSSSTPLSCSSSR